MTRRTAEIENVRKLGGDILILDDGVYPSLLREIYDPPITLYVKGAWDRMSRTALRGDRWFAPVFDVRTECGVDVRAGFGPARRDDRFRFCARH